MNNFELIDDYLSNKLTGGDKEAFEKQLNNDPTLKSEFDFQKQIIEGIRNARAIELKSMLSKVPVGGATVSMDFSVMKMAAGFIAAGVAGAAIYFYVTRGELPPFEKAATDLNSSTDKVQQQEPAKEDVTTVAKDSSEIEKPAAKESPKSEKKQVPIKAAEKPKLDVTDPSSELQNDDNTNDNEPSASLRNDITPSHVHVEMDSSNKKYNFHYQFAGSKLMLYGSFDRSLYEVLEINGDNHAVFLFYKDAYYVLDENQHKVTKLEPITDAALVNKLKEYRKR
jgi:hypothetical protein